MFSTLNPQYQFDVLVDSYVYIEPNSNADREAFQLLDLSTGLELARTTSPRSVRLDAGTYQLAVSQNSQAPQALELYVVGAIENWEAIPAKVEQIPISIQNMTATSECSELDGASVEINVTETGILDVVLEYGEQRMQMCLIAPLGSEEAEEIHNTNSTTPGKLYLQDTVTPGTYTLVIGARENTSADVIVTALGPFDSFSLLP